MTKTYLYRLKQRDGSSIFICQLEHTFTQDIKQSINLDTYALSGGLPTPLFLPFLVSVMLKTIHKFVASRLENRVQQRMLDGHHSPETSNFQTEAQNFVQVQQTVRNTLRALRYNINGDPTQLSWVSSDGLPTNTCPFRTQPMVNAIHAVLGPNRLISQHAQEVSFLTIQRTLEALFHELDTNLHLSGHVGQAWGPISIHEFLNSPRTAQLVRYLENIYQQSNYNFESFVHHLLQPTTFSETANGFEILYELNNVAAVSQGTAELTAQNTAILQLCSEMTSQRIQTLEEFLAFDYQGFLQNHRERAIQLGKALRLHHQGQQERPNKELRLHHLIGNNTLVRQKMKAYVLEPSKPIVPYVSVNNIPFHLITLLSFFAVREFFGMGMGIRNLPTTTPVQQPRPAPRFPPFPRFPNVALSQIRDDLRNRFQHVPWGVVQQFVTFTCVGGLTITNPNFLPAIGHVLHVLPNRQREALIALLKELLKHLTKKP